MIGMFGVSKAPGPAVLMAIFLVFTILVQITMMRALDPLMYNLPRTLQIEEEIMQRSEDNLETGEGHTAVDGHGKSAGLRKLAPGGQSNGVQKKGNFLVKFLKPWIYADYHTLRKMVPNEEHVEIERQYTAEIEANAYWPPSATSETPILWIPEDIAGVSKHEVAETSKVIPISDEGCALDEKNHIVWDTEGARPPIWNEKVYY